MFLIVFALQEGQDYEWAAWIWLTIAAGIAFMTVFVYWQAINPHEPLVPLGIFRDRGFSLSNLGIAVMGFVVTAMILPVMFYAQAVCGMTPTRSALLTAPMAVTSGLLAPVVGHLVDRVPPRPIVGFGFSAVAIALTWLSFEMTPATPVWRLVLPLVILGVGMAFVWQPLATIATRSLAAEVAGAGAGVYNTIRTGGSVLGSAAMAAFMAARINAEMPQSGAADGSRSGHGSVLELPVFLRLPFSEALSQAMLLPAFISLAGVVSAVFFVESAPKLQSAGEPAAGDDEEGEQDATEPLATLGRHAVR
jgi:MFS family permease